MGQIVPLLDKQLVCAERRRLLLPPTYTRYFAWGYVDQSSRIAVVEQERVRRRGRRRRRQRRRRGRRRRRKRRRRRRRRRRPGVGQTGTPPLPLFHRW